MVEMIITDEIWNGYFQELLCNEMKDNIRLITQYTANEIMKEEEVMGAVGSLRWKISRILQGNIGDAEKLTQQSVRGRNNTC